MEIDLTRIFTEAFGYDPPEKQSSKVQLKQAQSRITHSQLGQPYYAEDLFGREFFLPVYIEGILIPFAVIGMTWKKTIQSTAMPERGGSVNELISVDDYSFNIKGILLDDEMTFPETGVQFMHDLFKINQSVTLRSVLTDIVLSGQSNLKGDDPYGHRVVIKEVKWPAVSGIEHAKPFELELMSDLIFDLELE